MLLYSVEIINKTSDWVGGDINAREWLRVNNLEALVELRDASQNNIKSIEKLLIQKQYVLVAFVNAIWEDKKALQLLLDKKEFVWAAMANYINGDEKAGAFLNKNKLEHYLKLAQTIQKQIQVENDKRTNFFRGPFTT